jgi:hypothetical protein
MTKTFAITPTRDLLLRGSQDMPIGLYHLHIATAEQLTRLHYKPGMIKTVKQRLKALADNGFIQADSVPTKLMRSPYYYALAAKGMHYLDTIGFDTNPSFRASKEVSESYLHIRHALEVNDILIAALRLKHTHPAFYLARFVHERTLKHMKVSPIPDGFLDVRKRRMGMPELSLALILEHDRGTEQQEHFRRRIRAYKTFLANKGQVQVFGVEAVTVIFTTFIGSKRVQQMREWTKIELHSEPTLINMFLFADLPKPLEPTNLLLERRWYTPLHDTPIALLEG